MLGCVFHNNNILVTVWRLIITEKFFAKMGQQTILRRYSKEKLTLSSDSVGNFFSIHTGNNHPGETIEEIECLINQKYSVSCRREGDEVYLPFSFLHDYFEVFGTLSSTVKGTNRFEWSHTNAKVNYPKETYDPRGIFMYFENYNVEVNYFCSANR